MDSVFGASPEAINIVMIIHCIISILLVMNVGLKFVTPLSVYYGACIISCVGNLSVMGKIGTEANRMNAHMIPQYDGEASSIWALGSTAIFLGFLFFEKFSLPSLRFDVKKEYIKKMYYYILGIAIFFPELAQYVSFLGSITKLFYLAGVFGILFFARLWAEKDDLDCRTYALVLYVVQTYFAATNSYLRSELLIPTAVLFAGYFIGKGHIKAVFSYRIVPFALLFAAFFSIFSTLGKFRSSGESINSFADIITEQVINGEEEKSEDLFEEEEASGTFLDRSAVLAQLTNIVRLTKENGFYEGSASAPLLVALVPRFLWPDKPLIQMGRWFAVEIGVAYIKSGKSKDYSTANNSVNMTIPGELYLDFGWAGVMIGCFLFGGILVILWNSVEFYSSPYNVIGILFGGYLLMLSYTMGADLEILVTYTSTYILIYATKKIITDYL